jgi:HEAT repeat protein
LDPQGAQAVPLLMRALKDHEGSVRKAATLALGNLGAAAKPAVPLLFELLGDAEDRDAARGALRQIDTVGPEAVPTLIKALESDDRSRRFFAVFFLGKLGPAAKDALPALKRLQQDDSGRFRGTLEKTIQSIEAAGGDK